MPIKSTYNWVELKKEFFQSDAQNVAEWARHTESRLPALNNSSFRNKTIGWAEEKLAMKKQEIELTFDMVVKQNAPKNAKAYMNLLARIHKAVFEAKSVKELTELWHVIRVEAGLVTNIGKNENVNNNIDFGSIRDDMTKAAQDSKKKIKKKK